MKTQDMDTAIPRRGRVLAEVRYVAYGPMNERDMFIFTPAGHIWKPRTMVARNRKVTA